ncbi:MAG: 50S ribosomal protein L35 [Candidatus Buchananbacteria bacterium RIFCSPHIGHO2_02_FULL_40_13]|uniref:Large ribosomal subunit protein bL35 n=1 Tax=Candidatus Buchananbacteria bacterium RIFCSPLOWO2_01_FULL_39_33 TaxID=1797543 RepID=A0A1G1YJB8_9BACT|nr:MAG: 50S ribosomal protein L35 [Candidatus Buchananbacteria bacterium RIFCSPHIGHO2_01_FULL_40_35]OGY49943.1 MAG: 50S ribosomal protein L35 [Candidatus Buchananbacteria bacterium RIFCSPHIGHO2_02_FULL_40_13]OGY51916.1 MAG: 50S ribosomal protein L35 [Candidatus Buchananbacteria bacterium RIFCSPLOWO2_01_FULL_39_33]
MPKMKTKQAIAKRFKITKKGKILKRTGGQDHFNARESGRVKRNKRRDKQIAKADQKNIKRLMPYN